MNRLRRNCRALCVKLTGLAVSDFLGDKAGAYALDIHDSIACPVPGLDVAGICTYPYFQSDIRVKSMSRVEGSLTVVVGAAEYEVGSPSLTAAFQIGCADPVLRIGILNCLL